MSVFDAFTDQDTAFLSRCNVRCLFCRTGHEMNVARQIEARNHGKAIFPRKVKPFRVNGVWEDRMDVLLPGYLFVYSEEEYPVRELYTLEGVIRVLFYQKDNRDGWLEGSDRAFAEWIWKEEGLIGKLEAVKEGSYVHIKDDALKAFRGKVVEINKGRRSAHVVLDLMGSSKSLWLGYELLEMEKEADSSDEKS